jgi:hypothetical protein
MSIPTEATGRLPRPLKLLEATNRLGSDPGWSHSTRRLSALPVEQFTSTGLPVITIAGFRHSAMTLPTREEVFAEIGRGRIEQLSRKK